MKKFSRSIAAMLLCALLSGLLLIGSGCAKQERKPETTKPSAQQNPAASQETDADESTADSTDNDDPKEYQEESRIYDVAEARSENAPAISTLTFAYNGQTLTYPFTLRDMENIGITFYDHIKDRTVDRRGGVGNIDGKTAPGEGDLRLAVTNLASGPVNVMDCVVTYINTTNIKVAVNSVQPQTTTYEEVLALFGRDKEERKNTLYNENIRNGDNPDRQLDYSATFKEEGEVGSSCARLTIMMDVDLESYQMLDSVFRVVYEK